MTYSKALIYAQHESVLAFLQQVLDNSAAAEIQKPQIDEFAT